MQEPARLLLGLLLLVLLAVSGVAQPVEAPTADAAADWTVAADTVLARQARDVAGDVLVAPGATLELRGAALRVGGVLQVAEGARLVLGPDGGVPSRVGPLPGGTGFWLDVQGHVQSSGQPMTLVENLVGHGLDSAIDAPGGFRINGTADLRNLHVRNGTAGLVVGPFGRLDLRDSIAENLFLMGLAVLGNATLENATLRDNLIGVSGRGGCTVEVTRSTIHAGAGGFQMNSCRTTIQDSNVSGGNIAVFAVGPMTVTVLDSRLHDYLLAGVQAESLSTVELENVLLRPREGGKHGIDLKGGATLVADAIIARGHRQTGVFAQSGHFTITNSTLSGNGEYGLRVVRGTLLGDLDTIDFGSGADANGLGAYSLLKPITFQFVDWEGAPVPGNLTVHVFRDGLAGPATSGTFSGLLALQPEAMITGPDGRPLAATGHTLLAFHAALDGGCIVAPLDLEQPRLALNTTMASPPAECAQWLARLPAEAQAAARALVQGGGGSPVDLQPTTRTDRLAGTLTLALLGAGLLLVAAGLFGKPLAEAVRRRRQR